MTQFWILAGTLTVLALGFLLLPMLLTRKPAQSTNAAESPDRGGASDPGPGATQAQTGVAVYRAQLAELESDLATGVISQDQFEQAQLDLQRNLLEMSGAPQSVTPVRRSWRWPTTVAGLLLLPLAAVFIYHDQGTGMAGIAPASVPPMALQGGAGMPDLEAAIKTLSARLEANPDDPEGWAMLGRSFLFLGEVRSAAGAFAQAIRHGGGQDPDLLITYADLVGSLDGGDLSIRARPFIERALALDPDNTTGLWMAGMAAFQAEEYQVAQTHWNQLNGRFAPGSEEDALIQYGLDELKQRLVAEPNTPESEATP